MKRILALTLAFLMLLLAVACAKTPTETATEADTKPAENEKTEETEEVKYQTVSDPSMPQKLAAIPVAAPGMSGDQLRQICLDYMKLQNSFPWIPNQTYKFTVESQKTPVTLEEGKVYGGLPYVTIGSGNLYRIVSLYNTETGVLDVTSLQNKATDFGNACSGGVGWAWGRVINSANLGWTYDMTVFNGHLRVGPYTYDDSIQEFGRNGAPETNVIAKQNGEQVMYQSYAQMKMADGITDPGHVRMISRVEVVYKEDNVTIDGDKSIAYCCDQKFTWSQGTQSDGSLYSVQGGVDTPYTFKKLYTDGALPVTFKEFLGQDPVEKATVSVVGAGATLNTASLAGLTLKANYNISDVFTTLKDDTGKVLLNNYTKRMPDFFTREVTVESILPAKLALDRILSGGEANIEISCQLSTGEKLVAYSGRINVG